MRYIRHSVLLNNHHLVYSETHIFCLLIKNSAQGEIVGIILHKDESLLDPQDSPIIILKHLPLCYEFLLLRRTMSIFILNYF